jgi:hypothetical protein
MSKIHRSGTSARSKNPPTAAEIKQRFEPYATAIGHIAIAWNGLHEHLSILFWFAVGPEKGRVSHEIWHRLPSDRNQRDALRAAVEGGAFYNPGKPNISEEVRWLLAQADNLSDGRNNAIHGPLTALTDLATGDTRVTPTTFFGNKRAKKLEKKDIIQEFNWYCECIELLSDFAAGLIREGPFSGKMPDRPRLPKLQTKAPKND